MAASTGAGASGRGGCRRRVALGKRGGGRGMRRGPGGARQGALKRLKVAVEEFVQATSEGQTPGGREGPRAEGRVRPGGRKSRRELRKEKRQLRKARRLQRTTGRAQGPGPGGGGAGSASGPRAEGAEQEHGRPTPRPPEGLPPPQAEATHAQARAPPGRARAPPGRTKAPPGKTGPPAAAARKRALLAANEEEDREIRKLERCLGLNKRKRKGDDSSVPLSFARDGLDYILGALGSGASGGLYESSSEEEDAGPTLPESDLESDTEDDKEEDEQEVEAGAQSEDDEEGDGRAEQPEPDEAGESAEEEVAGKRVRFAEDEESSGNSSEEADPTAQHLCEDGEKYVPPPVRRAEETVDAQKQEERERLKKRIKGLLNRLSEPNMASISGQLEELYMAHSRKDVSDTLAGALLSTCAPAVPVPGRLVMEHVLLVSVLHRTVGVEVGAHVLEAVVRKFDDVYESGSEGKECDNLFTIVAHLYNFHVVQSLLVFDILKKLIGTFTEKDIELILLMLKNVGFSLRKDDALSLKELISEAQAKASGAGSQFQDQTRIRFMLETMLALKNNDMRKIPGYDPEPVERLRKAQRALVRGASSGTEAQLRVSWDGVLNAERTGRWWIVGSAWTGAPMIDSSRQKVPQKQLAGTVSAKMLDLARKQRMNTDVRRTIFCTIMTSEDFLDAFEKLLKLGLKDQQEREIVHVLVDCCLQEKTYNPFYAFLAGRLCDSDRRLQMTFQFSIWDKFRDLENLPATNVSNLVHLVGHLLRTKSLPLSILKVVEFSELDKPRVHFLRKVLHILLTETEVEDLGLIFTRVADNPKLGVLREGLRLFISHFLLKSAHAGTEEADALRARADLAAKALHGWATVRM
ncbi:nucleolar MIF4G domain-containing protein 1 isoform X2 [Rousettus aegyptiacus]|uniref:nucleolar MIF4G domain-containing protein 1 isoform X2 n=1 Tax=Rousettus aegyptiacus TaxID=9407 RepID=UPI00168CE9E5|nr:nucleolar MIF4G domain-containing protein 1 isoform X2 [Rousettus aegyptiacus]